MDAARFFEVAVPELARRRARLFGALRGTLAFIVRDRGGWTVQLGDAAAPVLERADPDADLVLSFTDACFSRFLDGTLDLRAALAARELAHHGDLGVLTRFSRLLATERNALSVRFGGA